MNTVIKLLNAKKILIEIKKHNQLRLKKLEIFDEIPSTNGYLLDHLHVGETGWVCLAEHQTQGYGRQGKKWFSVRGSSILCSLLWCFDDEKINLSGLSMAVAVMVMNALKKQGVKSEGIQVKWPNDVLFRNRKLAGILLERKNKSIVIGIGLNTNIATIEGMDLTHFIDLTEMMQKKIDRNKLTGLLLNELLEGLMCYEQTGLIHFIDLWRKHDYLAGKNVTVSLPDQILLGKAQGIADTGELLVLDQNAVMLKLAYGETSVRVC